MNEKQKKKINVRQHADIKVATFSYNDNNIIFNVKVKARSK